MRRADPRPRRLLAAAGRRHSLGVEALVMVVLYLAYDTGRGLAGGGRRVAVAHARHIARAEHRLGIFVEPHLQHLAAAVPGLDAVFRVGYDAFHLGVTGAVLLWLYLRRPGQFALVRTAIAGATLIALVGFVAYPTAPPRLAGVGVADTLHLARTTARSGVLRVLYNPYAAMPSLHVAYAVVVGCSLVWLAHHRIFRVVGVVYPLYVAVEVLATGNHFVFDVGTGAVVAGVAWLVAARLTRLDGHRLDEHRLDEDRVDRTTVGIDPVRVGDRVAA